MHPPLCARDLIGDVGARRGERLGVGHFEHAGHAAKDRRARAGLQILLVRRAGLAEMHLRVDDARQNVQPRAIDALARVNARQIADLGDSAAGHADVAAAFAVVIDERAVYQNRVESLGHPWRLACCVVRENYV